MPNIKSAKKRVLVNEAKAARNKAARSTLRTDLKRFSAAVEAGDKAGAQSAYAVAVKAVDQAAAHGLIHRNNAARKKSGLTLRLNKLEG